MIRFEDCSLAIIAGGLGERLGGVVKAHLRLPDGRTILQRMLEELAPAFDRVFVVTEEATAFSGLTTIRDVIPGRGAPGGVHAACARAETEWVLALASDLPFVSIDALLRLWRERQESDVVIAEPTEGRREPLHAFYRAGACAEAFAPILRQGSPSFSDLIASVRTRRISAGLQLFGESFVNINTPDDLIRHRIKLPPRRQLQASVTERPVLRLGRQGSDRDAIVVEAPLEIRVDGETLAVTMRTPGADDVLALGFLLGEGLIHTAGDVSSVTHCGRPGEEGFGNVIDVRLAPGVSIDVSRRLDSRRWTVTSSACGVCGRSTIEDLLKRCPRVESETGVSPRRVFDAMQRLRHHQPVFEQTGGLHAAALFDAEGELLACFEDIGRHNAVDKGIGHLLRTKGVPALLAVSGRASFEIVQKAAAARVPMVASVSAASSLAVDLADAAGITLISFVRQASMNVYTHPERLCAHAGDTQGRDVST